MDNSVIYEKTMNTYFGKLKSLRNRWSDENGKAYGLDTIIDIGGSDYRSYDYIMNECYSILLEMIPHLVTQLLGTYGISAKVYSIGQNDAHVYSVGGNKNWPEYVEQSNRKQVFMFSCKGGSKEGLYVFKEFGIGNDIPNSLLITIKTKESLKRHCYVSMMEGNAYSEVLNHNDDANDPTRGTGKYSLEQFFDFFFGPEEYVMFKKYTEEFTEKVKDYFGFKIVRTLKSNTLHNFRKVVRDNLKSFDITELDTAFRISDSQRKVIEKHFFGEKRYELLTGSSDFAQSYMTAEWLFSSLENVGHIDLTSIAMGYFKAIEQLLFNYIKLQVKEDKTITRCIFVGKGKPYSDDKGNAELTKDLMEDEDRTKDITLGALTGFFGFYDDKASKYYFRNKDLLEAGITDDTFKYIIEIFKGIVGLRNGYFHKHNLENWDRVVEARNRARLVFYLLLGAYRIDENDRNALGIINTEEHDDYYMLCEYINNKANNQKALLILPIFYFDGHTNQISNCWFAHEDEHIEYDSYGDPTYSGLYFKMPIEKKILKITKGNMPSEIWEGVWDLSGDVPNMFGQSGPQKKIYAEGKFLG